jgi:hypothetical protein
MDRPSFMMQWWGAGSVWPCPSRGEAYNSEQSVGKSCQPWALLKSGPLLAPLLQ